MSRFNGKSIVITGGTSGIGLATAQRIIAEGGQVLVTGRDRGKLDQVAAIDDAIHVFANDARLPEEAERLAEEAKRLFGTIDGVFLNAGAGGPSPLGTITLEAFRDTFELNVAGVLFGAQALAPILNDGGAMLVMSSGAKLKGTAEIPLYAGSKGAARTISMVLARALAPRGIRVNTISPGPIETPFHSGGSTAEQDAFRAFMLPRIPLGRFGTPEEAAAVATFLLSSESSFVTGADYPVDGGEAQL